MANKSTDAFKNAIRKELDLRAFKNPMFEVKYKNPKKNIDDCIQYIFDTVQNSGCNGFEDNEVYGMAVHYYSEDDIDLETNSNTKVVVNHKVVLTEKELAEAKTEAIREVIEEEKTRLVKKKTPVITKPTVAPPSILF